MNAAESNWPEPTPEPDEPPRWRGLAALVAIVSAVGFLAVWQNDWIGSLQRSVQLPTFEMPDVSLPDIDLRGRTAPEPSPGTPETAAPPAITAALESNAPVQQVPFDTCLRMITESANGFNQEPILMENTTDRRVAVFKFLEGDLTVTCSRADGTMTLQQRE